MSRCVGGLKMNTSKTKTHPAIYTLHYLCNQPGRIIIKYKRVACYKILSIYAYVALKCRETPDIYLHKWLMVSSIHFTLHV